MTSGTDIYFRVMEDARHRAACENLKTQDMTLMLVQASDRFRHDFYHWMADNFHVWVRFREEADKIRATGRLHYSARTIGEYLRHETALREASGVWKINDHVWPDMARLYMVLEPRAKGFFELRGRT
jgi:hypothetical protein